MVGFDVGVGVKVAFGFGVSIEVRVGVRVVIGVGVRVVVGVGAEIGFEVGIKDWVGIVLESGSWWGSGSVWGLELISWFRSCSRWQSG